MIELYFGINTNICIISLFGWLSVAWHPYFVFCAFSICPTYYFLMCDRDFPILLIFSKK